MRSTVFWSGVEVTTFTVVVAPGLTVELVESLPRKALRSPAAAAVAVGSMEEVAVRSMEEVVVEEVEVLLDVEVDNFVDSEEVGAPAVTVMVAAFAPGMMKFGAMLMPACPAAQLQPSMIVADEGPKGSRPLGTLL